MSDNSFSSINFDDPQSNNIFDNYRKNICSEFKEKNESGFVVGFDIKEKQNNGLVVSGTVKNIISHTNLFLKYSAANQPTYTTSFSGSGLPFPNEKIAFENSPNRGVVPIINKSFSFEINYPNSYYNNLGTVYVPPHVKILIVDSYNNPLTDLQIINLGNGIPFRTLTIPSCRNWNNGPLFYENNNLPVRTQYQILCDSAYPSKNIMPKNFWGLRPTN